MARDPGGEHHPFDLSCILPQDSILELPPSWVRKLTLDRDLAALRFPPKGRRTIFYRRAKAELFAENIHPEGITLRLTLYKVRKLLRMSLGADV